MADRSGYAGLSRLGRAYVGGLLAHAPPRVLRSHDELVPAARARFRGAREPRLLPAEPLGVHRIDVLRLCEGQAGRVPPRFRGKPVSRLLGDADSRPRRRPARATDPARRPTTTSSKTQGMSQVPGLAVGGTRRARGGYEFLLAGGVFSEGADRDLDRVEAGERGRRGSSAPAPRGVRPVLRLLNSAGSEPTGLTPPLSTTSATATIATSAPSCAVAAHSVPIGIVANAAAPARSRGTLTPRPSIRQNPTVHQTKSATPAPSSTPIQRPASRKDLRPPSSSRQRQPPRPVAARSASTRTRSRRAEHGAPDRPAAWRAPQRPRRGSRATTAQHSRRVTEVPRRRGGDRAGRPLLRRR